MGSRRTRRLTDRRINRYHCQMCYLCTYLYIRGTFHIGSVLKVRFATFGITTDPRGATGTEKKIIVWRCDVSRDDKRRQELESHDLICTKIPHGTRTMKDVFIFSLDAEHFGKWTTHQCFFYAPPSPAICVHFGDGAGSREKGGTYACKRHIHISCTAKAKGHMQCVVTNRKWRRS